MSQASYNYGGSSYKIDFASKPTYTWDNGIINATYDAPTSVLKNAEFNINTSTSYLDLAAISAIGTLILRAQGTGWEGWLAALTIISQLYSNQFFYLTSFPKWSGEKITQYPTFSVFVPNILPLLAQEEEAGFPVWILPIVFGVGICSVAGLGVIIWKRKRR